MSSARQSTVWELRRQQILLPKSGFELSECEDFIGVDEQNQRFAVADGATEAFDARSWAQRLAQNWVSSDSALTNRTAGSRSPMAQRKHSTRAVGPND